MNQSLLHDSKGRSGENLQSCGKNLETRTVGLLRTTASVVKTIIGSSILTISWSYYFSSLLPGLLFTLVLGMLSAYSFFLLGHCSEVTGRKSYSEIWAHTVGSRCACIVDLAVVLYTAMTTVGYWIIIGDCLPKGLEALGFSNLLQDRVSAILATSVIILPLNFLNDLAFLSYTSVLGIAGAVYTCSVLVFESVASGPEVSDWIAFSVEPGWFVMLPIVTFAFNGHFNAPALYQQLESKSSARWALVTGMGYIATFFISALCAVAGYIMLGSELADPGRSNVLTAPYLQGKREVMAAYFGQTVCVAFAIPLNLAGMRDAIDGMWVRSSLHMGAGVGPRTRHFVLSGLCCASTIGVSLVVSELGVLHAVNGAVNSTLLMFVFPPLMFLGCTSGRPFSTGGFTWYRALPIFTMILGVGIGITGVATTILLQLGMEIRR